MSDVGMGGWKCDVGCGNGKLDVGYRKWGNVSKMQEK